MQRRVHGRRRFRVICRRRVAQHALMSRHKALVRQRPLQHIARHLPKRRRREHGSRARLDRETTRPVHAALARASLALCRTRTGRRLRRPHRAFVERLRVARQRRVLRARITLSDERTYMSGPPKGRERGKDVQRGFARACARLPRKACSCPSLNRHPHCLLVQGAS